MSRAPRLNILIVASDGSRTARLSVSRRALQAFSLLLLAGLVAMAVVAVDYLRERHFARNAPALYATLAQQQSQLDAVQRRLGEVRTEVDGWREMHVRIWAPFGPDAGRARPTPGVGGPSAAVTVGPVGFRRSPLEELDQLALVVTEEGQSLRALERFMARAGESLAALPLRWPVRGAVNSDFGPRQSPWTGTPEFHHGLDIATDSGTPVHAPATATVVSAGIQGQLGLTVVLNHGADVQTVYGHLSKTQLTPGQRVERGAVIGLTGTSGRSSGPHLHYEIVVRGQSVNPRAYLWN